MIPGGLHPVEALTIVIVALVYAASVVWVYRDACHRRPSSPSSSRWQPGPLGVAVWLFVRPSPQA